MNRRFANSVGRRKITATSPSRSIRKAVDEFLAGRWAGKATRFVLCVRAGLDDTQCQDEIEQQARRLYDRGIVLETLDGAHLTERLKSFPQIVDDFFGRAWGQATLGNRAVASLQSCLDASRIVALRPENGISV